MIKETIDSNFVEHMIIQKNILCAVCKSKNLKLEREKLGILYEVDGVRNSDTGLKFFVVICHSCGYTMFFDDQSQPV